MENQTVEILREYKPHQVLALCLHFYNKGFYIKDIEYERYFKFENINKINNTTKSSYTLSFNIGDHEFNFTNHKQENYNYPKTQIFYKYSNIPIHFHYNYNENYYNDYKLNNCQINGRMGRTYKFYNAEEKEKEKERFHKTQNKIIKQLKFYEKNNQYIGEILKESHSNRTLFTIEYTYDFKPYVDNIRSYQKRGIVDTQKIQQLIDCVKDDMQDGVIYKHKILNFQRNNYNSFITTINKKFNTTSIVNSMKRYIDNNDHSFIDPSYQIIIPILDHLGGISALQNVILQHRILTE